MNGLKYTGGVCGICGEPLCENAGFHQCLPPVLCRSCGRPTGSEMTFCDECDWRLYRYFNDAVTD